MNGIEFCVVAQQNVQIVNDKHYPEANMRI